MLTPDDIKVERWEGEDHVITGLHHHGGVFTKREAETIVRFVKDALPVIQADAQPQWKRVTPDCLPEDCQRVIVFIPQRGPHSAFVGEAQFSSNRFYVDCCVEHPEWWMPLPKPPTK